MIWFVEMANLVSTNEKENRIAYSSDRASIHWFPLRTRSIATSCNGKLFLWGNPYHWQCQKYSVVTSSAYKESISVNVFTHCKRDLHLCKVKFSNSLISPNLLRFPGKSIWTLVTWDLLLCSPLLFWVWFQCLFVCTFPLDKRQYRGTTDPKTVEYLMKYARIFM